MLVCRFGAKWEASYWNVSLSMSVASCDKDSCRCKDNFDFADHVVLYACQYLAPLSIEAAYITSIIFSTRGTLTGGLVRYAAPLAACALLGVLCLRSMFFTSLYFHTPAEILTAFVGVLALMYFPLHLFLPKSKFWTSVVHDQDSWVNAERAEVRETLVCVWLSRLWCFAWASMILNAL